MEPTSVLPVLPIDFGALAGTATGIFSSVISAILPIALIVILSKYGLNKLSNAFGGKIDNGESWSQWSDEIYQHYKERLDANEDTRVPPWVRERAEFEEYREEVERQERRRRWKKMIQEEQQRSNTHWLFR